MKKILLAIAALGASVFPCHATEVAYNQTLVSQVVTTTTSFVLDTNAYGIDAVSFQATVASATPSAQTFKDGTISTGTISIVSSSALASQSSTDTLTILNNTNLAATQGTATILVSTPSQLSTGGIVGSTVTVAGFKIVGGLTYSIGLTTNTIATNLAAAINANVPNVIAAVSPVGGGTVTLTCAQYGSFCNSYTLVSSTVAALTISTGTFTGGNDNASFTIGGNGVNLIFQQGSGWTKQDVSSNTAISIVSAINTGTSLFTASTTTATGITIVSALTSLSANNYTLTSTTASLIANSAKFVGGQDNAFLTIDGQVLTQGNQWFVIGSSVQVSTSIVAAINANSVLSQVMIATAPTSCATSPSLCGIVVATGTVNLTQNNYLWSSSTQTAMKVSNSGLYGGTTSAYLINTTVINIPNHGYATGEEVKFSTGVVVLSPLTNNTSYYVGVVDSNDISLSLTSTGSIAGTYITLASSSTVGPHTFTLTPLALNGVNTLEWLVSNDCVNYATMTITATNVTVPINILSSPWAQATYAYDFGNIAYRCIELTVSGPGTAGNGGISTIVTGNGKRFGR